MEDMARKKRQSGGGRGSSTHRVQLLCAVALVVLGIALLVAGVSIPPVGEIHPSILVAFGEILTFVGAIFGIDYHYKAKGHNA